MQSLSQSMASASDQTREEDGPPEHTHSTISQASKGGSTGQATQGGRQDGCSNLTLVLVTRERYAMAGLYQQLLETQAHGPPYHITLSGYKQMRVGGGHIYTPALYTHPRGYHFKMVIWPNGVLGGRGSHVTLWVLSIDGDEDIHYKELKFPARFTITLELLNQHRDQDHHRRDIQCEMPWEAAIIGYDDKLIPHSELEWNEDRQTQYLKDDCLKLRINTITVHTQAAAS